MEKLEQAQDNSGTVIWAGEPQNASNINELENQLSKIKEQLKKAEQERQELQLEVHTLSSQVAKFEAEPQKKIADAPSLISGTSIDYSRLRNFLAAGEWEKANQETIAIITTALYKIGEECCDYEGLIEYRGCITPLMIAYAEHYDEESEESNNFYNAFQKFSCPALNVIDKLWIEYSYGRFGFSVQKHLYELFNRDIIALCIAVNWGTWNSEKGRYICQDKEYSIIAPVGHLPILHATAYGDYSMIRYLPFFLDKISFCSFTKGSN